MRESRYEATLALLDESLQLANEVDLLRQQVEETQSVIAAELTEAKAYFGLAYFGLTDS